MVVAAAEVAVVVIIAHTVVAAEAEEEVVATVMEVAAVDVTQIRVGAEVNKFCSLNLIEVRYNVPCSRERNQN